MKRLASLLLERAAEEFGCHGCSDFDLVADAGMVQTEVDEFRRAFFAYNGDPENFESGRTDLPDYAAMSFLAKILHDEALRDDLSEDRDAGEKKRR